MNATVSRPISEEAVVSSRMGRNTRVGSDAPCCAQYMKMVTGSSVSDEELSTRNSICALVAVLGSGLSVCRECIALRPIGVAALSSPSALAAKFSVISRSEERRGGKACVGTCRSRGSPETEEKNRINTKQKQE